MYPFPQPAPGDVNFYNTGNPVAPKSNIGWAAAAVVFFWPLCFAAFTHSDNVYRLWAAGDVAGAQRASDRAKRLGQIALGIAVGLTALYVVFVVVMATMIGSMSAY